MIHAMHAIYGVVGGGESSPLSAESSLTEVLHLVQYLMAVAILYVIKLLKDTKGKSTETHTEIQTEISEVRNLAENRFKTNNDLIKEVLQKVEALEIK
jgi:hypothetical protein